MSLAVTLEVHLFSSLRLSSYWDITGHLPPLAVWGSGSLNIAQATCMKQITCWGSVRKGAVASGLFVKAPVIIRKKLLQREK